MSLRLPLPLAVQVPPPAPVQVQVQVKAAANVSVTVAAVAVLGPALLAVIVYTVLPPRMTLVVPLVLVIDKSEDSEATRCHVGQKARPT